MHLQPPPASVVRDGCVDRFGMFDGPIPDTDLRAFQLYGPFGRLRLKQWQHFAVIHPQVALTFAVVDAGFQRLGWVQIVDRSTGERVEHARQAPWLDLTVASTLFGGRTWLRSGPLVVEIDADLAGAGHTVRIEAPELTAELLCRPAATPLEVVLPVGRGRAMWSHKVPLPVEGAIRWRGREIEVDPDETTAILDIHKAHYPHRTWWHWGTFAGRDADGRQVAVNLTRNVVTDPAMHECAMWVDGALTLLPPPTFALDVDPWTARGPEVDLRFDADGERREDLAVGPVVSRFRQRYGRWSGTVAGHAIERAWGLAEDHVSRW